MSCPIHILEMNGERHKFKRSRITTGARVKGGELPVPADLVESLRDLASFHSKDCSQPMLSLSRQRIGQVMKETARRWV